MFIFTQTTNEAHNIPLPFDPSRPDGERSSRVINSRHLWSLRQRSTQTQIPGTIVVDGRQILGDRDGDLAIFLGESVLELDFLVVVDDVHAANRVIIEPNIVVVTGILCQRVLAVSGGRPVEA